MANRNENSGARATRLIRASIERDEVIRNNSKPKFKVGDIVTGKKGNPGDYTVTTDIATMKVISITTLERFIVEIIDIKINPEQWVGSQHQVSMKHFKLAAKEKPTPQTKLIQYKPGTKIGDYVRKLISKEKDKDRLRWLKTFDNCILPQSVRDTIDEALTIVLRKDMFEKWGLNEHFEKGITNSILIHGPPGTGKTMVSESIAAVLGKNLMMISAASVQSNIPGQTERNMTDSFAKAGKEDAVVLFDECDSLFYNRDAVGAIMAAEINHFLTELERFPGVVLLTTNRLHKLDGALQRRIIAKIELGLPDAKTRELIWGKLIPEKMPVGDINFKILSKASLSGGDIKNVVILAARRAIAHNNPKVEMEDFNIACESVVMAKQSFESVQPKVVPNQEIMSDKSKSVDRMMDRIIG